MKLQMLNLQVQNEQNNMVSAEEFCFSIFIQPGRN